MTCKHAAYGNDTVASYAAKSDSGLREILIAFNAPTWGKYYAGNHQVQAYRHKFFKLARERGLQLDEGLGT